MRHRQLSYIPAVDGVRALAILMVVVYHYIYAPAAPSFFLPKIQNISLEFSICIDYFA